MNGRRSQLSVRGESLPIIGEPLRFLQAIGPYEMAWLDVDTGGLMSAIEWYTGDTDLGGRVLHILTTPAALARRIGFERILSFDGLWDALDASDQSVRHVVKRDHPVRNDSVAVAIGLPPGSSLWYESQFLQDEEHRSMALEVTYSPWQKVIYT